MGNRIETNTAWGRKYFLVAAHRTSLAGAIGMYFNEVLLIHNPCFSAPHA